MHERIRHEEGEKRFQVLLNARRWQDVPRVLNSLRQRGRRLNLRTYRACIEVLAECGRANEALGYLEEMEVCM